MKKLAIAFPILMTVVACSKENVKPTEPVVEYTVPETITVPVDTSAVNLGTDVSTFNLSDCEPRCNYPASALNDPNSLLSSRVVYFSLDSDQISDQYKDILTAHAYYAASNPSVSVRLDGHTDERGTREYNLALGERRAQAVKRFLVLNTAPSSVYKTNSFGEEMPAALGSNESAWGENRRVEIIYK